MDERARVAGLLCAGLAACGPGPAGTGDGPAKPGYDQAMSRVTATLTADSSHKVALTADSAWVYTGRREIAFRKLALTLYKRTGEPGAVVSAARGAYHATDAVVDLRDDVELITTAGEKLHTRHLTYNLRSLLVASDSAYTFETRTGTLRGAKFTSDLTLKGAGAAGRPGS